MKSDEILFSIIIPVYNAEKYIAQMVESVKKQTYTNWELILIDDGSTDNSGGIIDSFCSEKITTFHFSNQGQVQARLNGIARAKGDYCIVVDADDCLDRNYLYIVNNHLKKYRWDAIACSIKAVDNSMESMGEEICLSKTEKQMNRTELLYAVIKYSNHSLANKIIRTECLKKAVQNIAEKRVSINGDYLMMVPICCEIKEVLCIPEALYLYRQHEESLMHKVTFQKVLDTDYVVSTIYRCVVQNGVYCKEIEKTIFESYLHMVASYIKQLISQKNFKREDLLELHKCDFYQKSKPYECGAKFSKTERKVLIAVRDESWTKIIAIYISIRATKYIRKIKGNLCKKADVWEAG